MMKPDHPEHVRGNAGFTLVELLVVAVIGLVVIGGVLQVLISTQRVYTAQSAQMGSQQLVRAGVALLSGELRELSPREGDVRAMGQDALSVRVMRKLTVACGVTAGSPLEAIVLPMGPSLAPGDSVLVFADFDPDIWADDRWVLGEVTEVSPGTTPCPTDPAMPVVLGQGVRLALAPGGEGVRAGALLRTFDHVTYGLYQRADGSWFLGQQRGNGGWEPLLGPLRAPDPAAPLFRYFDANGGEIALAGPLSSPTTVRAIEVTVRSEGRTPGPGGRLLQDVLTTRIQLRN